MGRRGWLGAGLAVGAVGVWATLAPGGRPVAPGSGADDGAEVVGERRRGHRVLDLTVRSPVLPVPAHVRLLLPPGWSREAGRTWPVLWLLHGAGDGPAAWTDRTDIAALTAGRDVIVAMPDGGPCALYTDWWNHGSGGPPCWETFHLVELRQILERGYGAGARRAVAGAGLGGLGALAYAARHRGLFEAAACFSGHPHLLREDPAGLDAADLVELAVLVGGAGADWTDVWGDPRGQRVLWRQHDPHELADRLAGVRVYVSAGDGGPGPLDPRPAAGPDVVEALARAGSADFTGKLARLGVPATRHFYAGTGGWPYWRRELAAALPLLVDGAAAGL
ncbi:alpha/beta hydrolase [Actinomadura parmotrematis]|uniref:Esterase family protein n=1 Tax=Actinomadura parmotrematis TaxID=2864039 RepID=A0ABS7FY89_9ACTN|nr:alpha/beta hydrolase-fold protein [Actinomadura parmotrematis]MBW8485403.1 esterase family protein [Actinomadura parmotrematis]